MNMRQLKAFCEVVARGLRVSAAAAAMHTSQSGVSRQLIELEHELGVEIFVRRGNRLVDLTAPGKALIEVARRVVQDADGMKAIANDFTRDGVGTLVIATTHTHACYALPRIVQTFATRFPSVALSMRQGTPVQCCELVRDGLADLAVVTETVENFEALLTLPAYRIARCVVAPAGHPLVRRRVISLEDIVRYPLITYDQSFSSRRTIDRRFAEAGLRPQIVVSALDVGVSKKYVAAGIGVALIPTIAFDKHVDRDLRARDVDHLFDHGVVMICIRRNTYLRQYAYSFIQLFAPHLTRAAMERLQRPSASDQTMIAPLPFIKA